MRRARRGRRAKTSSRHLSISATDDEWGTVRRHADRRGLSIARYLVGLVERGGPAEIAGPALALDAAEQRELLEAVREIRSLMLEGSDAGPPGPRHAGADRGAVRCLDVGHGRRGPRGGIVRGARFGAGRGARPSCRCLGCGGARRETGRRGDGGTGTAGVDATGPAVVTAPVFRAQDFGPRTGGMNITGRHDLTRFHKNVCTVHEYRSCVFHVPVSVNVSWARLCPIYVARGRYRTCASARAGTAQPFGNSYKITAGSISPSGLWRPGGSVRRPGVGIRRSRDPGAIPQGMPVAAIRTADNDEEG